MGLHEEAERMDTQATIQQLRTKAAELDEKARELRYVADLLAHHAFGEPRPPARYVHVDDLMEDF